jgi:predicted SprT family Zn-dependent metalloprotease
MEGDMSIAECVTISAATHREAARQELARCTTIAARLYGAEFAPTIDPEWTVRGRCAGKCRPERVGPTEYRIRILLNPQLEQFDVAETLRTAAHEYAHAVGFMLLWRRGRHYRSYYSHGAGFFRTMAQFGYPDETRCHSLPLKRARRVRMYVMACECVGRRFLYSAPKLDRQIAALTASRRYRVCVACRAPLRPTGEVEVRT